MSAIDRNQRWPGISLTAAGIGNQQKSLIVVQCDCFMVEWAKTYLNLHLLTDFGLDVSVILKLLCLRIEEGKRPQHWHHNSVMHTLECLRGDGWEA